MINGPETKYDPFFGNGYYVFEISRLVYIVSIISLFIASLGNRPQGSKWLFTCCSVLFAFIMVLILYAGFFNVYAILNSTLERSSTAEKLFRNPLFRDLIIATCSTYGMYLVSSVLYFEPFHVIFCLLQYLIMLPSFVNILLIYSCTYFNVSL